MLLQVVLIVMDDGSDGFAPALVGDADDGDFLDVWKEAEDGGFDFEGGDVFAAGDDQVDVFAALDVVVPLGVGLGKVTGAEEAVIGEFLVGDFFGSVPVVVEDAGPADLDFAGCVGGGDDGGAREGAETDFIAGHGLADRVVDAVFGVEAAGEGETNLGHAVALKNDLAVGDVFPSFLDGSWKS